MRHWTAALDRWRWRPPARALLRKPPVLPDRPAACIARAKRDRTVFARLDEGTLRVGTKRKAMLPVYLKFRDHFVGEGFVARVEVSGRVLLDRDESGWAAFGVTPEAAAGTGASIDEAARAFSAHVKAIIWDFAGEATDFHDFRGKVLDFARTGPVTEAEWVAARDDVKRGVLDEPTLNRVTAELPTGIDVKAIELTATANENRPTAEELSLAAA